MPTKAPEETARRVAVPKKAKAKAEAAAAAPAKPAATAKRVAKPKKDGSAAPAAPSKPAQTAKRKGKGDTDRKTEVVQAAAEAVGDAKDTETPVRSTNRVKKAKKAAYTPDTVATASEKELEHLATNLYVLDEAGYEMVLDHIKKPYVEPNADGRVEADVQSFDLVMFTQKWGKFITFPGGDKKLIQFKPFDIVALGNGASFTALFPVEGGDTFGIETRFIHELPFVEIPADDDKLDAFIEEWALPEWVLTDEDAEDDGGDEEE